VQVWNAALLFLFASYFYGKKIIKIFFEFLEKNHVAWRVPWQTGSNWLGYFASLVFNIIDLLKLNKAIKNTALISIFYFR
jgi:hypothetical protein